METIIRALLVLSLPFFLCCEKETKPKPVISGEIYDTIKPSEYFPAYPGSYWVYDNNDTLKVADQYQKYIFNSAGYSAEPDYDTLILPKLILNGIFNSGDKYAFVKDNSISKRSNANYRDPAFQELFSISEGGRFIFQAKHAGTSHYCCGETIKKDTTISIGNKTYENVIITIHYDEYWMESPFVCGYKKEYYAKNIGLIKREIRNYPLETKFRTVLVLDEYFINNPQFE